MELGSVEDFRWCWGDSGMIWGWKGSWNEGGMIAGCWLSLGDEFGMGLMSGIGLVQREGGGGGRCRISGRGGGRILEALTLSLVALLGWQKVDKEELSSGFIKGA